MVAVGGRQGATGDLVDAHEEFRGGMGAEHFLDEAVDLGIAEGVDRLRAHFLFGEAFAEETGGVGVPKDVPAGLQFHFELGNREGPRAEGLHQTAFEVEETEQPTGVFLHREFSAQRPGVAGKLERIAGLALERGLALAGHAHGGDDGLGRVGAEMVGKFHAGRGAGFRVKRAARRWDRPGSRVGAVGQNPSQSRCAFATPKRGRRRSGQGRRPLGLKSSPVEITSRRT